MPARRVLLLAMLVALATGCVDPVTEHRVHGGALARRGEHAAALREYRAALTARPGDPGTLVLQGNSLFELGRVEEARRSWTEALARDARQTDAHVGLGLLAARQERPAEAARHFEAVVRQSPGDVAALVNLGRLYLSLGRADDARARLERALAIHRDDPAALYVLGRVELSAGELDEAERVYERLAGVATDRAWAEYGLAAVAARRGDRAQALQRLRAALARGVDDPAAILRDESFAALREDPGLARLVRGAAQP